jgi:hypothetical protein
LKAGSQALSDHHLMLVPATPLPTPLLIPTDVTLLVTLCSENQDKNNYFWCIYLPIKFAPSENAKGILTVLRFFVLDAMNADAMMPMTTL